MASSLKDELGEEARTETLKSRLEFSAYLVSSIVCTEYFNQRLGHKSPDIPKQAHPLKLDSLPNNTKTGMQRSNTTEIVPALI